MNPVVYLLAFGAATAFSIWNAIRERRAKLRGWREAARRVGLTDVRDQASLKGVFLIGRLGRLRVRLETQSSEDDTRFVVWGLGHGQQGLSLRREDLTTVVGKRFGARDIEIGDRSFDDAYYLQGSAPLALALLDSATRARVAALMRGALLTPGGGVEVGASLRHGALDVRVAHRWLQEDVDRFSDILAAVLQEAESLVAPPDLAARIAENLRAEPEAGVRLQCLATLAREFPSHPATREACLRAREDPDVEVRLRAGIALGPEGRDVILAIARGEGAPDETTERAVAALEPDLTVEEAMELLRGALRTRRIVTAKACLVAVGRRGGTEAIALLARVLAVETGELAWAAARALAITRDPAAEEPLLQALAGGPRDLRLAAAAALRHVGTAAAVAPLREAEQGDAEMTRAARQAIAEIQSRLTGAEAGQLSLAGGESGRLSIADGEEGRLSLATSSRRASSEVGDEGCAVGGDPHRARGKRQVDG